MVVNKRKFDYRAPKVFGMGPEKKELNLKPLFKVISLVTFLLLVYIVLFYSPIFKVEDIIVEGNKSVSKDLLLSMIPPDNLLKLNTSKVEKNILSELPEIKNIKIYKGIPNALKVLVIEREPQVIWESGGKKYVVSESGEVTRPIEDNEALPNLPLVIDNKNMPIKAGQKIVSSSFIVFIKNIFESSKNITGLDPDKFTIDETTFDINFYPKNKPYFIKLNSLRSSKKQLENLALVLKEKEPEIKEYIDMRIDGWGYYK